MDDRFLTRDFCFIRKASRVQVFRGTFWGGRGYPCFYLVYTWYMFFFVNFVVETKKRFSKLVFLSIFFVVVAASAGDGRTRLCFRWPCDLACGWAVLALSSCPILS